MAKRKATKKSRVKVQLSGLDLDRKQALLIEQLFSSQVLAILQHWNWGASTVEVEIGEPKIISKK